MNPDELQEVQDLFQKGMGIRAIARRLGHDVKTIRRALGRPKHKQPSPSKIEPFKPLIQDLAKLGLFAPRILREIRERGYAGSRTILKDYLRELRGPQKRPRKIFQRFETKPGKEGQVDWSPYRLRIGLEEAVAHCFSLILCNSRRIWIGFFKNERLPTLLHAHVEAVTYHGGSPERLVYDNMTTVTLGRVGNEPLWHPTFREFAKLYGFKPRVCKVKDPTRKGKVERPFFWIETDFLKGQTFASWGDLNQKARVWMDTVANVRKHSTTGRFVHEAYQEEKPFLIALPSTPFPTERREVRKVQKDGYLPMDGSFYPVPAHLVGQYVSVRIYPTYIEILDAAGQVAVTHRVPDRPTRLAPDWGPLFKQQEAAVSLSTLEAHFLARFPRSGEFLAGLKRRMNALTPIHLRQIERLVALYSDGPVERALERALTYRNFSALAVARILERAHPNVVPEPPAQPLLAGPEILGALDDIESGSPRDYTLDLDPPTEEIPDAP